MTPANRNPGGINPLFIQALVLVAVGVWIFSPVFHGAWLWDDNVLVTENPLMSDPAGLWKIWFQPGVLIDYYPMTFSVLRLEWALWGIDTLGYHLVSIALHLASAFLVWRLFSKLGLRLAWWGALIFVVHPVMVESVAWIAELKNTLSLPPFLLALCAWIDFTERGRRRDYFLSLGLFLFAILCKTTVFVFPVIILLHAYWKRGRIDAKTVRASLPFFAIAILFALIATRLNAPQSNLARMIPIGGPLSRLALMGSSLAFYFITCLWPVGLLPIYPQWTVTPPAAGQFVPWVVIVLVIFMLGMQRKTWGRHALLGFGFFLVALLPFSGVVSSPNMAFTWVMDHFLYIPIIGLIGLLVAGMDVLDLKLSKSGRPILAGIAVVITALLALESHAYAAIFRDPVVLWIYAVGHNPQSWFARAGLGDALLNENQVPAAINQLEISQKINPTFVGSHYSLARAFSRMGQSDDAIAQYQFVEQANPNFGNATYVLAMALISADRIPEATDLLERLLQENPQHTAAHVALGNIFMNAGRTDEATEQFAQASASDGSSANLHYVLGNALLKANHLPEALAEYQQAARISPRDMDVLGDLGVVYARMGRVNEAAQQFELMLQIDPQSAAAHTNMGSLLLTVGKIPEAIAQYQEALRIDPNFVAARQALARARGMQQDTSQSPK